MRRLARILKGALGFLAVTAPAVAADPAVRSVIENHPAIAGYFTLAVALLHDFAANRREKKAAGQVASSGSPTMGAK